MSISLSVRKTIIAVLALCGVNALAGSTESFAAPTDSASAMYTMEDIYQRLNTGATSSLRSGAFTEPAVGPTSGSMHTLNDIYALAGFARVPKTGQTATVPIDPAPAGSDGALLKGKAWPNPRFTNNGNGTVTDNLTGLVWLRNANVANAGTDWATALTWVTELNTSGTVNGVSAGDTSNGGAHQSDWRMPNIRELASLLDYRFNAPALCNAIGDEKWTAGAPFNAVSSATHYWSSTTYKELTTSAFRVYLTNGTLNGAPKTTALLLWPVRGGE